MRRACIGDGGRNTGWALLYAMKQLRMTDKFRGCRALNSRDANLSFTGRASNEGVNE